MLVDCFISLKALQRYGFFLFRPRIREIFFANFVVLYAVGGVCCPDFCQTAVVTGVFREQVWVSQS